MGWAGEQIKLIINTCYGNKELRPKIMEELSVLEANGVAELDTFTIHNTKLIADGSYDTLCEAIDSKDVGIKINNKRYLDPKGFFSFILDENKAAQDRDVDNAYNHIQRDLDNPNFHGIPGTSGTPDEGVPIELAMPEHLNKLKTLKKKESDKCQ